MWSLRPDLFRPSPKQATFQTPPNVAEERGWPAEGTSVPTAKTNDSMWSLRRDLFRPSPKQATFQTPPNVAEERGLPAEGTSVPTAQNK